MIKIIKTIIKKNIDHLFIIIKCIKLFWNSSKKYFIALSVSNVLSGAIMPMHLLLWNNFLNSVVDINIKKAILWLSIDGVLITVNDLLSHINGYFRTMQINYTNIYISNILLDKLGQFELENYDNTDTYNQISRVSKETLNRTSDIAYNITNIIRNLVLLAGIVGILFYYNYIIVIGVILSYFPIFITEIKVSRKLYNIYKERIECIRLIECLKNLLIKYENIKEIKIFKANKYIKKNIMETYDIHIKQDKKVRAVNLKVQTKAKIFQYIITYSAKILIVIDFLLKRVNIGSVNMYIDSIDSFQQTIGDIINAVTTLYDNNLYLEELFYFINEEPIKLNEGNLIFNGEFKEICFKNVYFKYPRGNKYVLKNINMRFEANKSYMIVGINGAGKTTIAKLISYLYNPTKGKILIDGIDINMYTPDSYRDYVSAIFQDFIKYPIDIESNIKIGDYRISNDERMKDAINKVGLSDFICSLENKYKTKLQNEWKDGIELSLGQWQRIAIARADFANRPILIMDEPTASLDARAESDLFSSIKNIIKNRMCILISHRMSAAKDVDYIYVIKDCQIIEEGSFASLIEKKGEFKKMFDIQAKKFISEQE